MRNCVCGSGGAITSGGQPDRGGADLSGGCGCKLVHANGQWMNVVVPFPAWAMKLSEADPGWRSGQAGAGASTSPNGAGPGGANGSAGPAFLLNPPVE